MCFDIKFQFLQKSTKLRNTDSPACRSSESPFLQIMQLPLLTERLHTIFPLDRTYTSEGKFRSIAFHLTCVYWNCIVLY